MMRVRSLEQKRREGGFTLVELMVVVAIIAILAAVGVPKMIGFIRTASTTEVVAFAPRIVDSIRGFADAHYQTFYEAGANGYETLNSTYYTLTADAASTATGELSRLIPHLVVPDGMSWNFTVGVGVTDGEITSVCVQAVGTDGFMIAYTMNSNSSLLWENNVFRTPFVEQSAIGNYTGWETGTDCATSPPTAVPATPT